MNDGRPIEHIGRYRLDSVLGEGGFAKVYQAFDERLQRHVAVKIPHQSQLKRAETVEEFLAEARTVASLEHPHIVPVYDFGQADDGRCYVVSKLINGETLKTRIGERQPSLSESVEIVRTIAETLHYVHLRGVVHRDIKPGNILLGQEDGTTGEHVFVSDFGLALRNEDFGTGATRAGTPHYMSPEQARGEGHLVDGRSDIFSLGVLLYRLTTGLQPFAADSVSDVLDRIARVEPKPPRQLIADFPRELERICLKALNKLATHRYSTAGDFAEELARFQATNEEEATQIYVPEISDHLSHASSSTTSGSMTVVPRGLRSFQKHDAAFFHTLLPGPYDHLGVPEIIRFWKLRVEQTDPGEAFRVGVIYGPSGCGKSSFIKAGLIPALSKNIRTLFVEAAPEQTEKRLLTHLGHSVSGTNELVSLHDAMTRLRLEARRGQKTLIVIDQFEQWLHTRQNEPSSDLAIALRQCDGVNLQCLLLIRDDFWLACSRFMASLEIELAQNKNMRLVDLFSPAHARHVLREFGRAYDRLPMESPSDSDRSSKDRVTPQQFEEFLDTAVSQIAIDGHVTPVRLALFAEMIKGRPWNSKTLKQVGGIEGVGQQFLEENFDNTNAPAERRVHAKAALNVLSALLPEGSTDIKGAMKSQQELMKAAEYGADQFRSLLSVLDNDLRLITPTDPYGRHSEDSVDRVPDRYYQLSHDFLVPATRDWVMRHQKTSRRGRAEMKLKETATGWAARPDTRHLPNLFDFLRFQLFTNRTRWTDKQREMMGVAGRRVGVFAAVLAITAVLAGWGWYESTGARESSALVAQLQTADVEEVPSIINRLHAREKWAVKKLNEARSRASTEDEKTVLNLALLDYDPSVLPELTESLLTAPLRTQRVLISGLASQASALKAPLWEVLHRPEESPDRRFRAALSLASFDPPVNSQSIKWNKEADFITNELIDRAMFERQSYLQIVKGLAPVRGILSTNLTDRAFNSTPNEMHQQTATQLLQDFYSDDPQSLVEIFLEGSVDQVQRTLNVLDESKEKIMSQLREVAAYGHDEDLPREKWPRRARRQSMAAALLVRYGDMTGLEMLRRDTTPDARSYFIHLVKPLGGDAETIVGEYEESESHDFRCGLFEIIGEYQPDNMSDAVRLRVIAMARRSFYGKSAQAHSMARWILSRWGESRWVEQATEQLMTQPPKTNQFVVEPESQIMVRLGGGNGEPPAFELAATETTIQQFLRFRSQHPYADEFGPRQDCPVFTLNWYEAVRYCRWLTIQAGMSEDDMCYPDPDKVPEEECRLVADYRSRRGFRLPTIEEWLFAYRGGEDSRFFFGDDYDLAGYYGIPHTQLEYHRNVVAGKPDRRGIFGMHGGVGEWCNGLKDERRPALGTNFHFDPSAGADMADDKVGDGTWWTPKIRYRSIGFRVARSGLQPDSSE